MQLPARRSAPFDSGEACACRGCKRLRRDFDRGGQRLEGHENANERVRLRRDGQAGTFGVGLMLKRNQIIGVFLHQRQPVDDKLVGLRAVQAEFPQRILQKFRCAASRHTRSRM